MDKWNTFDTVQTQVSLSRKKLSSKMREMRNYAVLTLKYSYYSQMEHGFQIAFGSVSFVRVPNAFQISNFVSVDLPFQEGVHCMLVHYASLDSVGPSLQTSDIYLS